MQWEQHLAYNPCQVSILSTKQPMMQMGYGGSKHLCKNLPKLSLMSRCSIPFQNPMLIHNLLNALATLNRISEGLFELTVDNG